MMNWALLLIALQATPQGTESVASAIDAAARGGVVIACRHGTTNQADPEDETTLRYGDPSTQRRLSPAGERQGEAVGAALSRLGIRFSEVIASPMQRAHRTAELMAGPVVLDSLWHTRGDNYDARRTARRNALSRPVQNGNRLIVSHVGTLSSTLKFRGSMAEGDCVVIRPRGNDYDELGLVPWQEWIAYRKDP
ncbi:MAG: histidine phosphatase family protein [Gemmatimonadota bacterium]